jgi:hypothetical protein
MMSRDHAWKHRPRANARSRLCGGSVAAEFALTAPLVILIAAGTADFGMLANRSAALAGAARTGAAYAMLHPLDTSGIQNSVRNGVSSGPALSFPASFPQRCECEDGAPIACAESCATVGRPGPNRAFIAISASQLFSPLVPWPGIPANVTATTEVRLQ